VWKGPEPGRDDVQDPRPAGFRCPHLDDAAADLTLLQRLSTRSAGRKQPFPDQLEDMDGGLPGAFPDTAGASPGIAPLRARR